jgi:hypothetical protein
MFIFTTKEMLEEFKSSLWKKGFIWIVIIGFDMGILQRLI